MDKQEKLKELKNKWYNAFVIEHDKEKAAAIEFQIMLHDPEYTNRLKNILHDETNKSTSKI